MEHLSEHAPRAAPLRLVTKIDRRSFTSLYKIAHSPKKAHITSVGYKSHSACSETEFRGCPGQSTVAGGSVNVNSNLGAPFYR